VRDANSRLLLRSAKMFFRSSHSVPLLGVKGRSGRNILQHTCLLMVRGWRGQCNTGAHTAQWCLLE